MKTLTIQIEIDEGREAGELINYLPPYIRRVVCDGEELGQDKEIDYGSLPHQRYWTLFDDGDKLAYKISLMEVSESL